jgi:PST family polysaccharide transporter/lipopolysaccharide exporter
MVGREVAVRLVSVAGSIVLARLLEPVAFGLFAISLFVVNFCELFGRLGLGPAFIRRRGELSARDLATLFTFQLVWVLALGAALVGVAPLVGSLYQSAEVPWLVRGLALAMILNALRTAPLVVAERNLAFGGVALSEVLGHLAYYLAAVPAAAVGLGTWSFVIGMVCAAAIGTAVIYWRVAWRPSLSFSWRPIRESLPVGLIIQGQLAAGLVKDTMMFSLGGIVYGATATGYLAWANQVTSMPLMLTQIVARVSYPAWARLQDDPKALAANVESTLKWTCRVSLPAVAVLAGLAPEIVDYVYGAKWQPALFAVYLLCANVTLTLGTTILIPALYCLGREKAALRTALGWAALTWLLALMLTAAGVGFEGLPLAMTLASIVALALALFEVRSMKLDLAHIVGVPLVTALASILILVWAAPLAVHGILSLIVLAMVVAAGALMANIWSDRLTAASAIRAALR